MRIKSIMLAGIASAAAFAAVPASAAVNLVSAVVAGSTGVTPTGTVWDTTPGGFYTLFVSQPYGNVLNPNDQGVNTQVSTNGYAIAGDGWPLGTKNGNSDPFYTLTLTLQEGAVTQTLTGLFSVALANAGEVAFTATSGPAVFGNTAYALSDFNYLRSLTNFVGAYSVASAGTLNGPGSAADYQGAFSLTATAVPEPATWAMMLVGFGVVGASMRRRPTRTLQAA